MKTKIISFLIWSLGVSCFAKCPDFSGYYRQSLPDLRIFQIVQNSCSALSIRLWNPDSEGKPSRAVTQLITFHADGKEAVFTDEEFKYIVPYRFFSAETGSNCLSPGWSYRFGSAGQLLFSMPYECADGKKGDSSEDRYKVTF